MSPPARFFRALADPIRLRLINLLIRGPLCVCDLQRLLGEPQSTVSRHLAYLKAAGLITDRRDGVRMFYALVAKQDALSRAVFEAIGRHLGRSASTFAADVVELEGLRARGDCHQEPPVAGQRKRRRAELTAGLRDPADRRAGIWPALPGGRRKGRVA